VGFFGFSFVARARDKRHRRNPEKTSKLSAAILNCGKHAFHGPALGKAPDVSVEKAILGCLPSTFVAGPGRDCGRPRAFLRALGKKNAVVRIDKAPKTHLFDVDIHAGIFKFFSRQGEKKNSGFGVPGGQEFVWPALLIRDIETGKKIREEELGQLAMRKAAGLFTDSLFGHVTRRFWKGLTRPPEALFSGPAPSAGGHMAVAAKNPIRVGLGQAKSGRGRDIRGRAPRRRPVDRGRGKAGPENVGFCRWA